MNDLWRRKAGNIISALITSLVLPIVFALFVILFLYSATPSYHNEEILVIICIIGSLGMLGVLIWYFVALGQFAGVQPTEADRSSVNKILGGQLTLFLGPLVAWLIMYSLVMMNPYDPSLGVICGLILILLIFIIGYALMLSGYGNLKNSTSFSPECQSGFGLLHTTVIINLILVILSLIPEFGMMFADSYETIVRLNKFSGMIGMLALIAGVVNLILTFVGWAKVKNNGPQND